MISLRPHPRRYDLRDKAETMDPAHDYEAIYRAVALQEFPWDTVTALNLAFYRVFAAPRMAELLVHTGEMEGQPAKRAQDTGLSMYEIIADGLYGERARTVISGMNRMHRRWSIEAEDFLYVLAAFVVVPTRWINDSGWRPLADVEVQATIAFYAELGRLMGIKGLPGTWPEIEALFDDYERRYLRYNSAAERLLVATQEVLADRLPSRARFLAAPLLRGMLNDTLCRCFGLRPAGPLLRAALRTALAIRGVILRRQGPRVGLWFTPGRTTSVYPNGYALTDLGVPHAQAASDPFR